MFPVRKYAFADGRSLELGRWGVVMGVLNVTPDSFSDGGKWNDAERAVRHAREMEEQGAEIIDLGAESSRPGFVPVSAAVEIERLKPLIEPVVAATSVPLSIDTYKAETARWALDRGVHMLNDIWGLQGDPDMAHLAAERDVPIVCMHNDEKMEHDEDMVTVLRRFFDRTLQIAADAGVKKENLILDPGIGFGKNHPGNVEVLRHLDELVAYYPDYPWLLGTSRKGFYKTYLGLEAGERDEATAATALWGLERGMQILRVHNVQMCSRVIELGNVLLGLDHGRH